jgi:biotin carboxyl carrier protein
MERVVLVYRGERGPEEIVVEIRGRSCAVARGGVTVRGDLAPLGDGRLSLVLEDGRQIAGRVADVEPGAVWLSTRGAGRRLEVAEPLRDRLSHAPAHGPGDGEDEDVRALMPGRVVEVAVKAGEVAPAGGLLLVLEAMKMQNEIRTARGGAVAQVNVQKGQTVDGGALLVRLKPLESNPTGTR